MNKDLRFIIAAVVEFLTIVVAPIYAIWERPAERLLAGELGLTPLAVLGELTTGTALEEGLAGVVQNLVYRLTNEAQPE